jgi:hypothetical protein
MYMHTFIFNVYILKYIYICIYILIKHTHTYISSIFFLKLCVFKVEACLGLPHSSTQTSGHKHRHSCCDPAAGYPCWSLWDFIALVASGQFIRLWCFGVGWNQKTAWYTFFSFYFCGLYHALCLGFLFNTNDQKYIWGYLLSHLSCVWA